MYYSHPPQNLPLSLYVLINNTNKIDNQILLNLYCPFYFHLQASNFQIIIKLEFLQETVGFFFLFWVIWFNKREASWLLHVGWCGFVVPRWGKWILIWFCCRVLGFFIFICLLSLFPEKVYCFSRKVQIFTLELK